MFQHRTSADVRDGIEGQIQFPYGVDGADAVHVPEVAAGHPQHLHVVQRGTEITVCAKRGVAEVRERKLYK